MPEEPKAEVNLADQYFTGDSPEPSPPAASDGVTPAPSDTPDIHPEFPDRRKDGTLLPKEQRKAKHTPRVLRMAEQMGISQEEVESSSPSELREAIQDAILERDISHRNSTQERTIRTAMESNAQVQPPAEPKEEDDLPTGDDWDERLVKGFGVVKELRKQVAELKQTIQSMSQHVAAQEGLSYAQKADAFFAKYPEQYGKGDVKSLSRSDPQFARRLAVLGVCDQHKCSFEKAHEILYGSKPAPTEKPGKTKAQEEWDEASTARPTQRNGGAEPNGYNKAVRNVAQLLAERKQTEPGTSLEEFPD